ncbi:hypothetical protein [Flavobacterium algicola]|uniref:hypothetical protein n=1 Tax=Flavobacterium algicola TaxID=556529 RepID=UPI001EFE8E06|nr:hypothetical protein [Flavobacterium algicola]MCG9792142.1 hypothetical protein [Flavobacterium algicola]
MKKLILSAAIVLGSLSTMSAQEAMPEETTTTTEQTTTTTSSTQTGFTEIAMDQVPSAVMESLKTAYPDAAVTKAYVNENKEYQLDVTMGDKQGSVFADETGKWIQK